MQHLPLVVLCNLWTPPKDTEFADIWPFKIFILDGSGSRASYPRHPNSANNLDSTRTRSYSCRHTPAIPKPWTKSSTLIPFLNSIRFLSMGSCSITRGSIICQGSRHWSAGSRVTCSRKCWMFRFGNLNWKYLTCFHFLHTVGIWIAN